MPLSPFIKRRRQQKKKRNLDREQGINGRNPLKRIEATVRKADEEKVENCTEDVDALLVFAGLYSAVLTAFLIESYKNLSADESESLLRRIAFQTTNYSFNSGYLNSTFDPSQLPAFQAAVSDIRVNVCWFASLILSLSSASFGIAVKQWLREYLSIDCIDPLERLRIRHARFEGLQDWKLFQIAAFLPILLQISLALFFVGLCFFTAAVHRSIEITSLLLVSCWAFFFFMSVIAPLFSPRCPYKTTLLKVPFRYARPYVQSFLRARDVLQLYVQALFAVLQSYRTTGTRSRTNWRRIGRFTWDQDYMDLGIVYELSSGAFRKRLVRGEEDMLRSADDNDIIIFCDVDGVFLDDRLLDSMRRTLGDRLNPLLHALQFVTAVIQRRSGFTLAEAASGNIDRRQPWPWTLSLSLRMALIDMLATSMESELLCASSICQWNSQHTSEWSVAFSTLVLLVSLHDVIPSSVARLFEGLNGYRLQHALNYYPLRMFSHQMWTLARSDSDWPARSLLFLAQALAPLKPEDAEQCLRYIVSTSFLDTSQPAEESTYRRLLECNLDYEGEMYERIALTPRTIVALLEVVRVILDKYTREQTHALDEFPAWISLLLEFVFDAVPRVKGLPNTGNTNFYEPLTAPSDGPGLDRVLPDLFATPHTTHALLHFFAAHSRVLPLSPQSDQSFFLDWIVGLPYPTHDAAVAVLNTSTVFFESHSFFDSPALLLRLCFLIQYYQTNPDADVDACWQRLCAAVPACYDRILNESDNKSQFSIGKLTCNHSASDDQHTDTCDTAYLILCRCDFLEFHLRASNEMVAFFCGFMCGSRKAHKFGYFPELDSTKNTQAEITALERSHDSSSDEQNTVLTDAKSSHLAVSDNIPVVQIPADSPDEQLDDERHASACEYSVPHGLVKMGDPAPTDRGPPVRAPLQELADNGSGGHDGWRAAESSQCADLARAEDREPQDPIGIAVIEGSVHEPRSMRLQENAASEPLEIAENVPVSFFPGSTLAVDSPPSLDNLAPDSCTGPVAITGAHPLERTGC